MSRRTAGRRVEKLLTKKLSKVLTYSLTYLDEVLDDVPSETWRLKPRLRESLAQVNSNTEQGPGE
ncbi:hypothetical protein F2Q70_00004879 [Brassica cretica]|uniref:Uncharacterized protein n=1 Tax=Brassica cretica TaxID=69181 RepID=A0A8S9J515_BRACR|nr:hypothetical protein F2Q70_00004879 [Brassica cretica]